MSLDAVCHQDFAQRAIQRALASHRMPHAYLFQGPDGVGKELFAIGLAQLLLCGSPREHDPDGALFDTSGTDRTRVGCGRCDDCRSVRAMTHPDLHMIYRQLNRDHPEANVRSRKAYDIGVDVLRHFVIDRVALTPHRGRAKLFIIREADKINVQAQNALLKTLEEPYGTTFLILLVTSIDRLLPTTLSRCQTVRFDPLPEEFVKMRLAKEKPDLSAGQVAWYTSWGAGSLGASMQAADDGLAEVNERVLKQLMGLVSRNGNPNKPTGVPNGRLIATLTEESKAIGESFRKRDPDITDTEATRRGLKTVMKMAATWYADILRAGIGDGAKLVNEALAENLSDVAGRMEPDFAIEAVNRLARAEHHLDLNANTQLVVETMVNDLAASCVKR